MKTWRCIRLGIVAMLAVKIQLAQQKQQRYSEIDYMPLFFTSIGILDVANCLVHLFVTTFMLKPECPGYNCIYLVHIHTRASMKSPNTTLRGEKGGKPVTRAEKLQRLIACENTNELENPFYHLVFFRWLFITQYSFGSRQKHKNEKNRERAKTICESPKKRAVQ